MTSEVHFHSDALFLSSLISFAFLAFSSPIPLARQTFIYFPLFVVIHIRCQSLSLQWCLSLNSFPAEKKNLRQRKDKERKLNALSGYHLIKCGTCIKSSVTIVHFCFTAKLNMLIVKTREIQRKWCNWPRKRKKFHLCFPKAKLDL